MPATDGAKTYYTTIMSLPFHVPVFLKCSPQSLDGRESHVMHLGHVNAEAALKETD